MAILAVIAYLALKLAAYTAWCAAGYAVLAPERPWRAFRSLRLGAFRLATGFVLGWILVMSVGLGLPANNRLGVSIGALITGIVALRWLEWSIVGVLIERAEWTPKEVLAGRDTARAARWRLGGELVSFATDFATVFGIGALGVIPC